MYVCIYVCAYVCTDRAGIRFGIGHRLPTMDYVALVSEKVPFYEEVG